MSKNPSNKCKYYYHFHFCLWILDPRNLVTWKYIMLPEATLLSTLERYTEMSVFNTQNCNDQKLDLYTQNDLPKFEGWEQESTSLFPAYFIFVQAKCTFYWKACIGELTQNCSVAFSVLWQFSCMPTVFFLKYLRQIFEY